MNKKITTLITFVFIVCKCVGQGKARQIQYMSGVNNKVLTGTITDVFFTTKWDKTFKWLKIGGGDTLVHVWPKGSETMVVGQKITIVGIKDLNQSLGPVISAKLVRSN